MKSIILALALCVLPNFASANPFEPSAFETADRVVELGETFLMNRNDGDFIPVRGGKACGLSAFQIGIRGDGAQIHDLRVIFGNGQMQDMPVRQQFRAGDNSRWIDLRGDERCLQGVYVFGRSRSGNPRQTRVVLRGLKNESDPAVLLGRTRLQNGRDLDFIDLRGQKCGLQKFKITVREDDARIDFLMLQFQNGQTQQIDFRQDFRKGSSSAWKDLAGNRRCIDKVLIAGRSSLRDRKQAVVEFWGQY